MFYPPPIQNELARENEQEERTRGTPTRGGRKSLMELNICRGMNVQYIPRVRYHGYRKYILLGKYTKSYSTALHRLTKAFETGRYKRGDVLMITNYYDPVAICEIQKV